MGSLYAGNMRSAARASLLLVAIVCAASRSHADPPSPSAPLATSQPTLGRLPGGGWMMVLDDESGAFSVDAAGKRTPKPHATYAGIATSADGDTWTKQSPMPTNESCGDDACPLAIVGDAQLAVGQWGDDHAYVAALASTTSSLPDPQLADAIAMARTKDGVTLTPTRVFVENSAGILDKFSIDAQTNSVAVCYVAADTGHAFIATIDGLEEGERPKALRVDELTAIPAPVRAPIFRRSDADHGYLAYMRPRDAAGSLFDLDVYSMTRLVWVEPPGEPPHWDVTSWHPVDLIFHRDSVAIDPVLPGALGRRWRDAVPIDFELGDIGRHLYLAYREIAPDLRRSIVVLAECRDDPFGSCTTIEEAKGDFDGWTRHEFDDCSVHGGQYQPTIGASTTGRYATLSWYERASADPSDPRVSLKGARSTDDGQFWSTPIDLRRGVSWSPCPSARGAPFAPHDYGDRFGAWSDDGERAITAFTGSTTCEDHGDATYDQHVETVSW